MCDGCYYMVMLCISSMGITICGCMTLVFIDCGAWYAPVIIRGRVFSLSFAMLLPTAPPPIEASAARFDPLFELIMLP